MLWTIAVILFILWILGFFVIHVGGGLIHILLVIAVIVIIYRLVTGRPARRLEGVHLAAATPLLGVMLPSAIRSELEGGGSILHPSA